MGAKKDTIHTIIYPENFSASFGFISDSSLNGGHLFYYADPT